MLLTRIRYYLSSIPTLFLGIQNWPVMLLAFLGLHRSSPFIIRLRNGCQFNVRDAMDIWIIKETILDRDYEKHGVPLQDGWVVFDIGAGLGDFATATARQHPHSKVYAWEPFPESFALLQKNLKLNNITNVQAFPNAVGETEGPTQLQIATGVAVKHSTAQNATEALTVESKTLPQIFAELELDHCDFLKMDCEGGEYSILLNSSPEILQKFKHISLEYHEDISGYTHRDLVEALQNAGFAVKVTPNPAHQEIGFLYAVSQANTT